MKQIVFITKSKLSQNLMGLIIPFIPQKIIYSVYDSLEALQNRHFAKPVHLMIFDQNVFNPQSLKDTNLDFLKKANVKNAEKILIHVRHAPLDTDFYEAEGFKRFYTKPFLTEELMEIVKENL